IFVTSAILVAWNCFQEGGDAPPSRRSTRVTLAGLIVLVLISFRCPRLDEASRHHWSVFVGPAELVRQGGAPPWGVASQYGYLSTLVLAWLPTADAWQSLYLVQALILFLTSGFVFLLLRTRGSGAANFAFALTVAVAAVLGLPGVASLLTGPQAFPSVGAYRVFWCYALLAVLLWEARRDPAT